MLKAENLGYRVGTRWLVNDVSLHVEPGEFWVIGGANGAGKSTLLRLLSGELAPHSGHVELKGTPLRAYEPRALARLRACLAQDLSASFPFTAYEVALMGRIPWQGQWASRPHDHYIAKEALAEAGVAHLESRDYPSLSGGERRRVDMARTIAQEPKLLLLDEPTNHLDAKHQIELMEWCWRHTRQGGCAVAVLHDLNLAARFADRILLLKDGHAAALGTPEEVLTPENLRACFNLECVIWRHPSGCPWVVPVDTAQTPRFHPPVARCNAGLQGAAS
ncbi:MAG: heme ABC transporter ATP-binding protein [Candidatus Hydrogenedentes bacterium]|nr:heme ABC transporter ATP-binding protein [Candidatus Hydrogenedentota bacterium]